MVVGVVAVILCCCIFLFLDRYRSAMVQSAQTSSAPQPSRFKTPKRTASPGSASRVTALTPKPHRFRMRPWRSARRPRQVEKPEARMKVQQMACCHSRLGQRKYQPGSRANTSNQS